MSRLDPPARYDQARRDLWADTIARLTDAGGLFTADPAVLDTYVEARAAHADAAAILAQTHVLITRNGQAVENPALAVQRRCADTIARTSRALGLGRAPTMGVSGQMPRPVSVPSPPVSARWCDRHKRAECTHHRRRCGHPKGVPPPPDGCCHEAAIGGADSCRHHAGKTVARVRAEVAERGVPAAYGGPPLQVSPAEALLAEVRRSAGIVAGLQVMVAELERTGSDYREPGQTGSDHPIPVDTGSNRLIPGQAGLWAGVARQVTRLTPDGHVTEVTAEAGPHVILQAYNAERAHLARVAKAAVDAGAQQAAVDLARLLGAEATRLIDSILAGLELNERQRDVLVPQVVPAALRAWAG